MCRFVLECSCTDYHELLLMFSGLFIADRMEFAFLVPENAQLRARISLRSNLKYVPRVLE